MARFAQTLSGRDELRALYREPSALVQRKKLDHLDATARAFVAASPFCLMATSNAEGRCDVSPRGGPAGFVRALDEHRLALPDLSGNNLLDSLENIVDNPHVGMLFVLPGRDETLRVEGNAVLTTDPEVLASWDGELRRPKVAIGVEVGEAFVHCAKSFRRGQVWDAGSWAGHAGAPDACVLLVEGLGLDATAEEVRASLEKGYAHDLEAERTV
ncbi:MAG: pyridoxamine 5'-phosphate oxidase family protein [Acidimicrobiia bacterium]|nr:pyridoxamine 5'-phosphate oxidase family protein [Acidimicrobiia bacterium]